ncbi:MAG: CocE/NonD family hydrolase C-terminal non-catalytic domain-containing protein, partial [Intestinibacter sp.]
YISSDAVDTDFMVRITDVDENGKSIKLADGIISAKYRNSFEKAEYLEKDNVYKINILTTKISNTFKKGHKIRFTVTSSAKNFVFPNSNRKDGFNSTETVIANNKIHHGGQYPSKIIVKQEI